MSILTFESEARHRGTLVARPSVVRPSSTPEPVRHRRRLPRRIGGWTVNLLLVLAVAAFLLLAIGPRVFGYQTATMLTGSMSPQINPGDVVVAVAEPVEDVQVGDVISYHIPVDDHRVETHRIIEVLHHNDGSIAVRTQGDNNPAPDPWVATLEGDSVWEVKATVPYVGTAIRALRTPAVQNTLMYGGSAILVLGLLRSIWGRDSKDAA
jgi:signal peptidase